MTIDTTAKKQPAGYTFERSYSDEPHKKRKLTILSKHPEIEELYGIEWRTKWMTLGMVVAQLLVGGYFGLTPTVPLWIVTLVAWIFGGTVTHSLAMVIHDCSHDLAAKSVLANRMIALLANVPNPVPAAMSFRRYHLDHHTYQGVDDVDADLPNWLELRWIKNITLRKIVWLFLFPFWYSARALLLFKTPKKWELINMAFSFTVDAVIIYFFGMRTMSYLLMSVLFGLGFHPCAGNFIQEHYTFEDSQETYSYYGPLNRLQLNVGHHNEHHDFTKVPWSRLPYVREMAPEFYNNIRYHTSWVDVLLSFVSDDKMGPHSRVFRKREDHDRGRKEIRKLKADLDADVSDDEVNILEKTD